MAGDDKSSEDFTTNYDAAARDAVGACNDLVDAFATFGILTATSIDNHRKANAGSVYGKPLPCTTAAHCAGTGRWMSRSTHAEQVDQITEVIRGFLKDWPSRRGSRSSWVAS